MWMWLRVCVVPGPGTKRMKEEYMHILSCMWVRVRGGFNLVRINKNIFNTLRNPI